MIWDGMDVTGVNDQCDNARCDLSDTEIRINATAKPEYHAQFKRSAETAMAISEVLIPLLINKYSTAEPGEDRAWHRDLRFNIVLCWRGTGVLVPLTLLI